MKQLDQMLHKAGAKAIPKYREIKSLKTCGKGIWNSKISQKSKEAKRANWQWKNSRKTNSNSVIHTGCCKLFEVDLPSIH
jgi:hypothetical protein